MASMFPVKKSPTKTDFSVLLDDIKGARQQSQMGFETKEPGGMQLDSRQHGEYPWRAYLSRLE